MSHKDQWIGFIKLSTILVIILSLIRFSPIRFYNNHTNSMPIGTYLYIKRFSKVELGDKVAACISDDRMRLEAIQRGYISVFKSSPCANSSEVIVKHVVGIPGDLITKESTGIYINGTLINNSKIFAVDGSGRFLPEISNGIVPRNKFVLIGDSVKSFDSRYFGLINESDIIANVYYIGELF